MNAKIILSCVCLSLLFSCKKEKKSTDNTSKLYPVTFKVSDFSQTQVPLGNTKTIKTASLSTNATDTIPVDVLHYLLYNNTTNMLYTLKKASKTDSGFGNFNENLAAGNYTAIFGGGGSDLDLYEYQFPNALPLYYFYYKQAIWKDTFYKNVTFTVTNAPLNQTVSLDRVTAQLQLRLTDAIPAGVTSIKVSFPDAAGFAAVSRAVVLPRTYLAPPVSPTIFVQPITAADAGKTNYQITLNTLNNITPFTVAIDYYTTDPTHSVSTKVIPNVVCKTNTRTILSGNLFKPGNTAFTIQIDQDWATPINIGF